MGGWSHRLAPSPVQGRLTAVNPTHISGAVAQIFRGTAFEPHTFPPTMPVADTVAGLNDLQPDQLFGYASMLHRVAHEAKAGRLAIAAHARWAKPARRSCPRSATASTMPSACRWATSTGRARASSPRATASIHGSTSARTSPCSRSWTTHTSPSNRDSAARSCSSPTSSTRSCRSSATRSPTSSPSSPAPTRVRGRVDGSATPKGAATTGSTTRVSSYTRKPSDRRSHRWPSASTKSSRRQRAADVAIVIAGPVDLDELCASIASNLASVGVDQPELRIRTVDAIERHSATAKLRRFVPL